MPPIERPAASRSAHGLLLAFVLLIAACAGTPPAPPLAARAQALMHELSGRDLFQGAVVIGRAGRIEYAAGFGFADLERRVPFTPDTPTDGASITKTFTAAALLVLADERRLDLEAPVHTLLPGYPHAGTRVRHLLAHAAGLPDYDWFDAQAAPGLPRSNADQLALLARVAPAPAFAPGSAYAYDNVAYDMAALVVERVTGRSYAAFVEQRFARPLGLQAFVRPARLADWSGVRTRGYRRTAAGWAAHDAFDLEGFHGGGNLYLSARDLYRWLEGYPRVVGPAVARAAVAPARLDDGRTTGLTPGSWYVADGGARRYYTGHHNGFHNFGYADDTRGIVVAWVANDSPPAWLQSALARALIALAEGRAPAPLVPPPVADPPADPVGRYPVPGVGDVTVRREGRALRIEHRGVDYQAFAVERGVHYVPGLDAYLRFATAADGRVRLSWDSVFALVPAVARAAPP